MDTEAGGVPLLAPGVDMRKILVTIVANVLGLGLPPSTPFASPPHLLIFRSEVRLSNAI